MDNPLISKPGGSELLGYYGTAGSLGAMRQHGSEWDLSSGPEGAA